VTLHGLFDRIVIPKHPQRSKLFFVFYKIDVKEPCTVKLAVFDPSSKKLGGKWRQMWRDTFPEPGPIQSVWALTTSVLDRAGQYRLELQEESEDQGTTPLASMALTVEREAQKS
jgi:hypothetical protein